MSYSACRSFDTWPTTTPTRHSTIALMSEECRHIVAFGGGGFSMESGNPLLDDYVLGLAPSARPRICFLPSASGDADHYIVRFYRAFPASRCEPSHISLFRREQGASEFRSHLLSQDVIYVGGGSVISLIGVWRAHGIDSILREAWESGVVLCGLSAGSLCWFAESVTGFHGEPQRVEGLGLLPWSNCVHYEAAGERRAAYRQFLLEGMRPGYAAEDGTGLHFKGVGLSRVVSSRPDTSGWRLEKRDDVVAETRLPVTYLGASQPATPTLAGVPPAQPA
jgi:peptidase E